MNPYIELGVTAAAGIEDVKRAYRKAVLRYHPDTAVNHGDTEKLNAVLDAYKVLVKELKEKAGKSGIPKVSINQTGRFHYQYQPQEGNGNVADEITVRMPLEDLAFRLENSSNPFVKIAAVDAIARKGTQECSEYLAGLVPRVDHALQKYIVKSLGRNRLKSSMGTLFTYLKSSNYEIVVESIKSLEQLAPANKNRVLLALRRQSPLEGFGGLKGKLRGLKKSSKIGEVLLRSGKIDETQLETALLLQKRFHIFIGQILRQLDYLSLKDIRAAIASQRRKNAPRKWSSF